MDDAVEAGSGDKGMSNALQKSMEEKRNGMEIEDPPSRDMDTAKSSGYHNMELVYGKAMDKSTPHEEKKEVADVNMEAGITTDDVLRAGGFGVRDDIGSLLPAAIDLTDFEASLRDARDFEDKQVEISRPGLGWTKKHDDQQG